MVPNIQFTKNYSFILFIRREIDVPSETQEVGLKKNHKASYQFPFLNDARIRN